MIMICEDDQLFARPVPKLTDDDLDWMDEADQVETIATNYEAWEDSRAIAAEILTAQPQRMSLAQRLTRRAIS